MKVNPLAILLIALATVIGAVFFHAWVIGQFVGLAVVLVASLLPLAKR